MYVHQVRKFHEFGEPPDPYSNMNFFVHYWSSSFYTHPLFEFETDKKSYRKAGIAQWVQRPGYGMVCPGFNPGKGKRFSVVQNGQPDSAAPHCPIGTMGLYRR